MGNQDTKTAEIDEIDGERTREIEVADDLRCKECGSTEMGNCFYCKMD